MPSEPLKERYVRDLHGRDHLSPPQFAGSANGRPDELFSEDQSSELANDSKPITLPNARFVKRINSDRTACDSSDIGN